MGKVTVDERNPGARQVQRFAVRGGLSASKANSLTTPLDFLVLKNCVIDKRIGAVLKRPGSTTESLGAGLPVPNGIGEYETPSASSVIPTSRTLLACFGGTQFRKHEANTWSTVSATSYVNFATSRQYQFVKLGTNLYIAGGLPAKWAGGSSSIDRVGIIPPMGLEKPEVTSLVEPGPGVTWISGATYYMTYYDSATGLESDWSIGWYSPHAVDDKGIGVTINAATSTNWDRIRLYRTLDGGQIPYFVTDLPPTTTYYVDRTPDEQLTQIAPDQFKNLPPPENVFVQEKYANRIWMVDGDNPYRLVFSEPYTGSDVDLEYFPADNFVISNEPITGLRTAPGKMLVFHPRGISYISGGDIEDFSFQPWTVGVGTVFPHSISDNGSEMVFLAEQGFVSIPLGGGTPNHISREIDLDLQPLLAGSYNASLYVSSCWSTSLRQFIFSIGAQSLASAPWEEVGTGSTADAVAGWKDSISSVTETWEDESNLNPTAAMKVRIWGWSPELSQRDQNIWMEYEFPTITNDNLVGAYPISVMHPKPSSDTVDPQQDKTFLALWDGTDGEIRTIFRRDKSQDDSTAITSEILTGRIKPGIEGDGYKLFHGIGFDNSYADPTSDSNAVLKYLIDYDDPHLRSYIGQLISISSQATDIKLLPTMLARHIHLHVVDTSTSLSKILLSEFYVHFRERLRRQGR